MINTYTGLSHNINGATTMTTNTFQVANPAGIPAFISVTNGITLFIDGNAVNIPVTDQRFPKVVEAYNNGDVAKIKELTAPPVERVKAFIAQTGGVLKLVDGEVVDTTGKAINNYVATQAVSMSKLGLNPQPLLNFLEKLRRNPSHTAQEELGKWVDKAQMPIDPDGDFYAYKKVRADYTSIHDSTFRNDLGTVVSMPRGAVDDNRDRTCSNGLHFCSKDYLPMFGSNDVSNCRVVLVKINPEHVVSIPSDYGDTKGRACEYLIVKDVTDEVGLAAQGPNILNANQTPVYGCQSWEDDEDDWNYGDDEEDTTEEALSGIEDDVIEEAVDSFRDKLKEFFRNNR